MAVPPVVAVKATQSAAGGISKALTGDIYTRKRTRLVGKGKKAHVEEDELRVNPVGIGLGVAALGAGALALGVALWVSQLKLQPNSVPATTTVVDTAGHWDYVTTPEQGHFEDNVVVVGYHNEVVPGHWKYGAKGYAPVWTSTQTVRVPDVTSTTGQHWVVDVPAQVTKNWVPEVSHQEPTGKMTKKFSIEQRKGFSFSDITDALNPVGPGARVFGDWSKGKVFGPWFGRKQ